VVDDEGDERTPLRLRRNAEDLGEETRRPLGVGGMNDCVIQLHGHDGDLLDASGSTHQVGMSRT
jgi:hypothetical protein